MKKRKRALRTERTSGLPCRCPFGANNNRTRAIGANREHTRGVDRTSGEDRSQATCAEQRGRVAAVR